MSEFKCQFCGKVFKTEVGFNKHCCEKKSRYINFDIKAFETWKSFMKISHTRLARDEETNKMRFISTTLYNFFISLSQWMEDMDVMDKVAFITYCYENKLPCQKWLQDRNYINFIHDYINKENKIIACKRSEKYLQENGLNLEDISANRLFFLLMGGKISNKYLLKKGIDIKSILDNGQLSQLGDLI